MVRLWYLSCECILYSTFHSCAGAPTVASFVPNSGIVVGDTITITGTNLAKSCNVVIGAGSGAPCSFVSSSSTTNLVCTAPAASAGLAPVLVQCAGLALPATFTTWPTALVYGT